MASASSGFARDGSLLLAVIAKLEGDGESGFHDNNDRVHLTTHSHRGSNISRIGAHSTCRAQPPH